MIHHVEKPIERSRLRRWLGREFYIAKRFLQWHFSGVKFSKIDESPKIENVWKEPDFVNASPKLRFAVR